MIPNIEINIQPNIQQNISLKLYNTFGIETFASYFADVTNEQELLYFLQNSVWKDLPKLVIGGGSNILFTKNFEGLVLKINLQGRTVIKENQDFVWLKIGAGENWQNTVLYAIANNWGGIENLALIYGTVGAAPMQNIGAYGVELKETFDSLEAIEIATGKKLNFDFESCKFGYRQSIFKQELKHKVIITNVTLRLTKHSHKFNVRYGAISQVLDANKQSLSLETISAAVMQIRQSKLPNPTEIGNAGSFFKNPEILQTEFESLQKSFPDIPYFVAEKPDLVKIPAGWLIEQCGWKGKQINNVGVHKDQALVLVNYGEGNGNEIWELAMQIQTSVKQKFGIMLHNEVNIY